MFCEYTNRSPASHPRRLESQWNDSPCMQPGFAAHFDGDIATMVLCKIHYDLYVYKYGIKKVQDEFKVLQ